MEANGTSVAAEAFRKKIPGSSRGSRFQEVKLSGNQKLQEQLEFPFFFPPACEAAITRGLAAMNRLRVLISAFEPRV